MDPQDLQRFEGYLRDNFLRLTPQRRLVLELAAATNEPFHAETLFRWLKEEHGDLVTRATAYRTLDLLEKGGFLESVDTGRGQIMYRHFPRPWRESDGDPED